MPGEQLTSVWQAIYKQDSNESTAVTRDGLQKCLVNTSEFESVAYSERTFKETFPDLTVRFADFKEYVRKTLREKGVPFTKVCNDLEEMCWDLVKPTIKSTLEQGCLYKLWKIANRLVKEDTYPPVICRGEACWLSEKILSTIGRNMKSSDDVFKKDSFTFQEMLEILDEFAFGDTSKEQTHTCIDDLYTWIVVEVMKKGVVRKRTKKRANWTNWVKRWCVLTPQGIGYYGKDAKDSSSECRKKGEFAITKNTKLESLGDFDGVFHNLQGRFRLANIPVLEMEIAVDDENEKRAWLSDLEEIIDCLKDDTTPIQKLLKERHIKSMAARKEKYDNTKRVDDIDTALQKSKIRTERQTIKKVDLSSSENTHKYRKKHEKENVVPRQHSLEQVNQEKLKAMFMKIDKNGNGLLDIDEFENFLKGLGLNISEKERNLVFKSVDTNNSGQITFEQFQHYFCTHIMDETGTAECVSAMRKAFLEADRKGSGTLNFREFTEFVWEKNRSARMTKVLRSFANITTDEISFSDFEKMVAGSGADVLMPIMEVEIEQDTDSSLDNFESRLHKVYDDTDADELAGYIRQRWNKFATFRRAGNTGSVVMKGGHGMVADFVPGEYSLIDLACFSDLPPLIPKHTVVKGFQWQSSVIPGKSGKAIFPPDFDRKIVTQNATSELLRYYECSFADSQQEKVSLLFRHGIQDFTYENGYLDKYVTATNGGAGIEKHDFSHLDCPLSEDSGIFILAKYVENGDLHVTGFRLPVRHTLYVPGGTIHCNDYLKGTWRTMLSDETDIDHVHLTQVLEDGQEAKFKFIF